MPRKNKRPIKISPYWYEAAKKLQSAARQQGRILTMEDAYYKVRKKKNGNDDLWDSLGKGWKL